VSALENTEITGHFHICHGETPTVADICLVTQVTPAKTFDCSRDPYPRVMRVYEACMAIPAFADAHPAKQPDAE
jgi:glutathione S-transferase